MTADVPFPDTTTESILKSLDGTLAATRPRFAMLDHVSSQPAIVMPLREMIGRPGVPRTRPTRLREAFSEMAAAAARHKGT